MNDSFLPAQAYAPAADSLEDKWRVERGRVYLSGTQALLRLLMLQRVRDLRDGHQTAGFLSGYRGSPVGGVDQAAWRARAHLERHRIHFSPGVNEDLAATAVWGSQQVGLFPGATCDGVFGMWYGKGPGADRSADVFKHASAAGTSPLGGVLAVCGDDHAAESSTLPHQSDHLLKASLIPVLFPADVQEYLDLGLHGYAMSRYAGVWVGFKCVTEVIEASASVIVDPDRVQISLPGDFAMPPGGLNIRWPDRPLDMEARLLDYKLYAALAYCRSNRLNRVVIDAPGAQFGIIASGKAYLDTRQALADLGLDEASCREVGIRLFKCAMVWPLEAQTVREFAEGLTEILVIEEKRQVIEYQLKEELFQWIGSGRAVPRVIGKFDEKDGGEWTVPQGNWILPAHHEFSPAIVARAIATRIAKLPLPAEVRTRIAARLALIDAKERALAQAPAHAERVPYFCPGCPHNRSTEVPEGSRAVAGIGCHYMVTWMNRRTATFSQMGGEGVAWIGQAPFTRQAHVFANLGDGTYFHSGSLAVRAAVAAGVPITYKILYNDAVAMTGGQPVDGKLTVPQLSRQLAAEGVRRIVVVSADAGRFDRDDPFAPGVEVVAREQFDAVQRALREYPGVSALIYDQTCAAELRRRRKRGLAPDPERHVVIHETLCEGCGDCSRVSNCMALEPVETEFGTKRRVHPSTCNKDFSCLEGFCPSLVTVEGRRRAQAGTTTEPPAVAPPAAVPAIAEAACFGILIAGIGGTGIVTIGQLLGMAAHIEGRAVTVLDMAGLAQKGGAVHSHVQIAQRPEDLHATRIATGEADLVIASDLVVGCGAEVLSRVRKGRTHALVSGAEVPTAAFVQDPDWRFPGAALLATVRGAVEGPQALAALDAQALALRLLGDSIYANALLLGAAWQLGWVPLARASLLRAMELNGAGVEKNCRAFEWGRAAVAVPAAVERAAQAASGARAPFALTLDDVVAVRAAALRDHGGKALEQRYRALVERARLAQDRARSDGAFALAVARNYFRVLAAKDIYEVARQLRSAEFRARVEREFEPGFSVQYYLAPPLLARPDPQTGVPRKRRFGAWMGPLFGVLASLRFLRGTRLDPFGHLLEGPLERRLVRDYEDLVEELLLGFTAERAPQAAELASFPDSIRGYGHIKREAARLALGRLAALRAAWAKMAANPSPRPPSPQ